MLKRYKHAPAHLFIDNAPYFITGAIYEKRALLKTSELKQSLFDFIEKYFKKYDWKLHHWVILDNHYHLIVKSYRGSDLALIIRNIHSYSGIEIVRKTGCKKPVWWNYWDYCPRGEKDYMACLNYLLYNPVKHGYVRDLKDYLFSSFHKLFNEIGREQLIEQFKAYPDYKTWSPNKKE